MFNSIDQALDWLYNQKKIAKRENLGRIKRCLELLNITTPYKIVHIAGTNGKGATAYILKELLFKSGAKVGLFTSPYVLCFNERITVDERFISDFEVINYCNYLADFSTKYYEEYGDVIPFFELTLLMALLHFKEEKIDYAIIECGIGGLLDATNCLDSNTFIITNIGFDHRTQLGDTKEDIAQHKLGILKGGICFTCVSSDLKDLFEEVGKKTKTSIVYLEESVKEVKDTLMGIEFNFEDKKYELSLAGSFQAYNAVLALATCKYLLKDIQFADLVLKNCHWAGRFELIKENVILDGAHNVSAIQALVMALKKRYPNKTFKFVYTALKEKDIKAMIEVLDTVADFYYFTTIPDRRATLPDFFCNLTEKPFVFYQAYQEALTVSLNSLKADEVLVITGSLHFISFARKFLIN